MNYTKFDYRRVIKYNNVVYHSIQQAYKDVPKRSTLTHIVTFLAQHDYNFSEEIQRLPIYKFYCPKCVMYVDVLLSVKSDIVSRRLLIYHLDGNNDSKKIIEKTILNLNLSEASARQLQKDITRDLC